MFVYVCITIRPFWYKSANGLLFWGCCDIFAPSKFQALFGLLAEIRGAPTDGLVTENVGWIFPNEIAIFHRDNDQQNHWENGVLTYFQTHPDILWYIILIDVLIHMYHVTTIRKSLTCDSLRLSSKGVCSRVGQLGSQRVAKRQDPCLLLSLHGGAAQQWNETSPEQRLKVWPAIQNATRLKLRQFWDAHQFWHPCWI